MTTVCHARDAGRYTNYVHIGRPTVWGNPFILKRDGNRDEVVRKYREWFHAPEQSALRERARVELKDKVLGCFCVLKACHGQVIAEWVNADK